MFVKYSDTSQIFWDYIPLLYGITSYWFHPPWYLFFFFTAQQPLVGQGVLIIEASRSYSYTQQSTGLLWTSDRSVAMTSTWQQTAVRRDKTSMGPEGFEPAISASKPPQTYVLDGLATGSGPTWLASDYQPVIWSVWKTHTFQFFWGLF
jgi:hypothetical protein